MAHETTPVRLLLVAPKPPPMGGIAKWTSLILELTKSNPNLSIKHLDTAQRWRLVHDNRAYMRVLGGGLQGIRDGLQFLWAINWFRPSVVHITTSGSLGALRDIVFLVITRVFLIPSILHFRIGRTPEIIARNGVEWTLLRIGASLANRVIVVDRQSAIALSRWLPAGKVVFVPNMIDSARRAVDAPSNIRADRTILYLGWVIPTKGLRELMAAWDRATDSGWVLKIAGPASSSYISELKGLVLSHARVEFLGECSSETARMLMSQAEIFVLPTYTEGFPNVILEAMAAGKAIVATRVGAIPEMLGYEGGGEPCGVVIPPQDAASLANAIRLLMRDSELRVNLGLRARLRLNERYTSEAVYPQYVREWFGLARIRQ